MDAPLKSREDAVMGLNLKEFGISKEPKIWGYPRMENVSNEDFSLMKFRGQIVLFDEVETSIKALI
jgi:hypothetical protein